MIRSLNATQCNEFATKRQRGAMQCNEFAMIRSLNAMQRVCNETPARCNAMQRNRNETTDPARTPDASFPSRPGDWGRVRQSLALAWKNKGVGPLLMTPGLRGPLYLDAISGLTPAARLRGDDTATLARMRKKRFFRKIREFIRN